MRKHRSRKHPEAGGVQPVAPHQIQREAICVDGMPVCRGCGKVFHHMQTLLRHVRLQRCPGTRANNQGATDKPPPMSGEEGKTLTQLPDLVKPAPQPKVSSEPLPMMQRAEHLISWHEGGAAALLSSLQSNVDLRKELMQHCCVCRQWMSDPRRFKTHIEKAHSELFATCHEDALNDCRGLTGAIMNPCEYCKQPQTKKVRHALGCPILYQVAFACRAHGRSHQRECKLSLRGHTASYQPPQPGDKGGRPPATPLRNQGGSSGDKTRPSERPQKFQKQQKGKGKGDKGDKSKRQREESEPSSGVSPNSQMLSMMTQLLLRHEDSVNILRLDKAYSMMFKTSGEETILATVHNLEVRWRELQETKKTDCAKRIALFKGVLLELQTRVKNMIESEAKIKELIKLGWMSKQDGREPMWLRLVWNVELQKDVPSPDMGPLPNSQAVQALEVLLEHACGQVIQRFHAKRPMAQTYKSDMLEFMLEVSLKGTHPVRVHEALGTLCYSSLWLLIGARLRPELPKRSELAKKLQHMIGGKC